MSLQNPKVGFVSLGCPKALVDSERILTQLRVEGYDIVPTYDAAIWPAMTGDRSSARSRFMAPNPLTNTAVAATATARLRHG